MSYPSSDANQWCYALTEALCPRYQLTLSLTRLSLRFRCIASPPAYPVPRELERGCLPIAGILSGPRAGEVVWLWHIPGVDPKPECCCRGYRIGYKRGLHPQVQKRGIHSQGEEGKGRDGYPPLLGDGGGTRKRRDEL
jgi:hypothetical protein